MAIKAVDVVLLPEEKIAVGMKKLKSWEKKIKSASKQKMIAALALGLKENFKGGIETVGVGSSIEIGDNLNLVGAVNYNRTSKEWTFGVGPAEEHTLLSQFVQVGSMGHGMIQQAQGVPPVVVRADEEDVVRFLRHGVPPSLLKWLRRTADHAQPRSGSGAVPRAPH